MGLSFTSAGLICTEPREKGWLSAASMVTKLPSVTGLKYFEAALPASTFI